MCEPISIATAIGGVASFASGVSQANAVEKHQRQIAERNQQNADIAARNAYYQTQLSELQEAAAAGQQIAETAREVSQREATVIASAANSNISGASVDQILDDFAASQGRYNANVRLNQTFVKENAAIQRYEIQLGHDGRIVSSQPPVVRKPDFATAALTTLSNTYNESETLQGFLS